MEGPRLNCVHLQKQVVRKWMKLSRWFGVVHPVLQSGVFAVFFTTLVGMFFIPDSDRLLRN